MWHDRWLVLNANKSRDGQVSLSWRDPQHNMSKNNPQKMQLSISKRAPVSVGLKTYTHTHTHAPPSHTHAHLIVTSAFFEQFGGSGLSLKMTKSMRHRRWDRERETSGGKTPGQQRHGPEKMKVSSSSFLITLFKALTGEKVSRKTVLTSYIWHSSLPECAAQLSAFSVLPLPSLFTYLHSSAVREITCFFF